jgi:CheY-like chemotaxis protein
MIPVLCDLRSRNSSCDRFAFLLTFRQGKMGEVNAGLAAARRHQVLVVDDDPDVRTMLRTQLEVDGYQVMEAADGNQAWKMIQQNRPAVVIADIHMPHRSGLELCRMARAKGFTNTGFVAYTAGLASAEECRAAGFDAHFLKTDPLPRLSKMVQQLLDR